MAEKDLETPRHEPGPEQTQDEFAVQAVKPTPGNNPPVWMWIGVGTLFIVALLVVFVLPAVVSEYELPLERRVEVASSQPGARGSAPAAETISPFEEAQRARQRKEAQDALAALLENQNELEALEVTSWAGEDYAAALEQASSGDEYYRSQEFSAATESYTRARDALAALLESVPEVASRTLSEGEQALEAGDSTLAEDRFSLARLLDPESEAAGMGLARARALDEVLALFTEAERRVEDGDLQGARQAYRQALDLDSYNERARQRIEEVSASIREQEFSRVMSEGYAMLDQRQPEQAIAAFQRALNMGVNEAQARAAIEQTETEVANARITQLRARLLTAEASERWADAVALYDEVLAIDPNLTFASEGRDYASKRAQLDALLENAIANPERFAEDAVYEETIDVYYTGRSLDNPGPHLQAQLDTLQVLLENARVPIEVTFVSDNLTEVTLLRENELGQFEQKTVALTPGRYVAIGSRIGYREVREEFVVGFGQTPESVVVRCEERVVATSR